MVHSRLQTVISTIIAECLNILQVVTLLPYNPNNISNGRSCSDISTESSCGGQLSQNNEECSVYFLPLSIVLEVVRNHGEISLEYETTTLIPSNPSTSTLKTNTNPAVIRNSNKVDNKTNKNSRTILFTKTEAQFLYSSWLYHIQHINNNPQKAMTKVGETCYDVFLSYRWGLVDGPFVAKLFDVLSTSFTIRKDQHRGMITFMDTVRLRRGSQLQVEYSTVEYSRVQSYHRT